MNNFKVGDKVWYDGEVRTVIQVPDEKKFNEVGYLHKDYVVLDLDYENAIPSKYIELYKSAHDKLIELGIKVTFEYNEYTKTKTFIRFQTEESKPHFIASYYFWDNVLTIYEQEIEVVELIIKYIKEYLKE